MTEDDRLKVLVVDDDPQARRLLEAVVQADGGCRLVGSVGDGARALQDLERLRPDVVTLDLEMPGMGGFALLRLIMARRPTPVIIVSGQGDRTQVFKALELGALDFVVKPGATPQSTLRDLERRLGLCLRSVRKLRALRRGHARSSLPHGEGAPRDGGAPAAVAASGVAEVADVVAVAAVEAEAVVCVGASTGGPGAIERLLGRLAPSDRFALLIAQHMPARFTASFAARLDQKVAWRVSEATDGAHVMAGHVYIAPGQQDLVLRRHNGQVTCEVLAPAPASHGTGVKLAPSVDRLLESASVCFGSRATGIILSGMGEDGVRGSAAIRSRGGRMLVQRPDTATLPTMPLAVIGESLADAVCPVEAMPGTLDAWRL